MMFPGLDLTTTAGKAIASVSGLSLLLGARYVWRGQAVAALFRYGALLLALLGALMFADVVRFNPGNAAGLVETGARIMRGLGGYVSASAFTTASVAVPALASTYGSPPASAPSSALVGVRTRVRTARGWASASVPASASALARAHRRVRGG